MSQKKTYRYSTGETFEADTEDLKRLLRENQEYLDNYLELYSSLEDDEYGKGRRVGEMVEKTSMTYTDFNASLICLSVMVSCSLLSYIERNTISSRSVFCAKMLK